MEWHRLFSLCVALFCGTGFGVSAAAALGCRTLDIIHMAAALVIGVKKFVTFDHRQAALARMAGLNVKP